MLVSTQLKITELPQKSATTSWLVQALSFSAIHKHNLQNLHVMHCYSQKTRKYLHLMHCYSQKTRKIRFCHQYPVCLFKELGHILKQHIVISELLFRPIILAGGPNDKRGKIKLRKQTYQTRLLCHGTHPVSFWKNHESHSSLNLRRTF